jgi:ferredoxin-NADP reductase
MAANNTETWQDAVVVESTEVAAGIRRIVLEVQFAQAAEPGSHIDVVVDVEGQPHRRSYSVVESMDGGRRLAVSVFRTSSSRGGSIHMHSLRAGDTLRATTPLQNFPLRIGAAGYVLVAGGIGITAIAHMADVLRRVNAHYRIVYAGRRRDAMAYLGELEASHGDRLATHIDAEGTALDVGALVAGIPAGTEVYMCGPIRLMDAVRRAWAARDLPLPDLRYETFGNSGWFEPEEFTVRVPRLGVETIVGRDRSMLEALQDAGVDLMFDCRKGECGLCEVKILGAEGRIDHRDVFLSERQQRAADRMCACVSRVAEGGPGGSGIRPGAGASRPASGRAVVSIDV